MKILNSSLALLTLISSSAFAQTLTYTPSTTLSDPEVGQKYELDATATENITGAHKVLTFIGEGLRYENTPTGYKRIYLAQFFSENPTAMSRDIKTAQSTLDAAGMKALKLTFTYLFPIPSSKVAGAFNDALGLNITSADNGVFDTAKTNFINAVQNGSSFAKNTAITLVGYTKADGSGDQVIYEDSSGTANTVDGPKGFANKIFAIWFGNINPSDTGLLKLEPQLLGNQPAN